MVEVDRTQTQGSWAPMVFNTSASQHALVFAGILSAAVSASRSETYEGTSCESCVGLRSQAQGYLSIEPGFYPGADLFS